MNSLSPAHRFRVATALLFMGCCLHSPPVAFAGLAGHWTFLDGTDETGNFAPGTLSGGASFSGGCLNVNAAGGQFFRTGAYSGPAINAKTLVAWVYVTDLNARGGSVLTLENSAGADVFDGIVYAERQPLKWMAGSDNWLRTQDVTGAAETTAQDTLVQIAVVYGDPVAANNQNRITIYRNGGSYGTYLTGGRITYSTGADAVFGKRHEDTSGTAFFTGRIEEARIYDTAMTQAEIAALTLTAGTPPVISQQPQSISAVEGGTASFTIGLQSTSGASWQWRRNGQPIPSATSAVYSLGPLGVQQDSGASFDCIVTNPFGSKTSDPAVLTVNPDVTPPSLTGVSCPGDASVIVVAFSEPVDPVTAAIAANYTIPGGTVVSARLGPDGRSVVLRVSGLAAG
ncbi:MAG TPA: LamG-like jellyroll fold domain-containing protein, partial [Verrucomicrobiales bacterium]|nr:LamG-like jellyroll fold domain-containing protein [Verrucomicrobiales bacterium]